MYSSGLLTSRLKGKPRDFSWSFGVPDTFYFRVVYARSGSPASTLSWMVSRTPSRRLIVLSLLLRNNPRNRWPRLVHQYTRQHILCTSESYAGARYYGIISDSIVLSRFSSALSSPIYAYTTATRCYASFEATTPKPYVGDTSRTLCMHL